MSRARDPIHQRPHSRWLRLGRAWGVSLFLGCTRVASPPVAPGLVEPAASAPTEHDAPGPLTPRVAAEAPPVPDFVHPEREQKLAELVPKLSERVDAFFAARKPPSLAVAFVADGEVRLRRVLGMANVAKQVPAGSNTLYRIGSVTKTFTAALILALRETGQLELDHPAEEYLPELARVEYPFADSPRITLRHLLSHTSGLPRLGNFNYTLPDADVTEAVLLRAVSEAALESAPGTRYAYSNFGMSIVGLLAGRRSSEGSLRAALAARLTEPLGMASTTFEPAAGPPRPLATGYADGTSLTEASLWRLGVSEGAGGLWSSLDDMARWVLFQLSAWPARPEPERGPVRRASLREQHTAAFLIGMDAGVTGAQLRATASGIGLGWHTRQTCEYERIVEHGGAIDGFKTSVVFAPERGFGIVVLANAIDTPTGALEEELLALAAPALPARVAGPASETVALLSRLAASLEDAQRSFSELFTRDFRAAVPAEKYAAISAQLVERHGRCSFGETLSLDTAHRGEFVLRCERGAIHATADVTREDGTPRFAGLRVRSTGFPTPAAVLRAAEQAMSLFARWDDQRFGKIFADPALLDKIRTGFGTIANSSGACRLAADAATGHHGDGLSRAELPLDCERGGPLVLHVTVDPQGKIAGILFVPRKEDAAKALRCTAPKP